MLAGSRLYTAVEVVPRTGSTNADLLAAARAGAAAGCVLVAEEQTAGRGRLDRKWQSLPGAALTFSVLVRPTGVPSSRRGWLPLLTGVAVATALRAVTGVEVSLKSKSEKGLFLPFLGEVQTVQGARHGDTVTFSLPPITKGAVFWVER